MSAMILRGTTHITLPGEEASNTSEINPEVNGQMLTALLDFLKFKPVISKLLSHFISHLYFETS